MREQAAAAHPVARRLWSRTVAKVIIPLGTFAIAFETHREATTASATVRSASVLTVTDLTMDRRWSNLRYVSRSPDEVVLTLRVAEEQAARLRNAVTLLGERIVIDQPEGRR